MADRSIIVVAVIFCFLFVGALIAKTGVQLRVS